MSLSLGVVSVFQSFYSLFKFLQPIAILEVLCFIEWLKIGVVQAEILLSIPWVKCCSTVVWVMDDTWYFYVLIGSHMFTLANGDSALGRLLSTGWWSYWCPEFSVARYNSKFWEERQAMEACISNGDPTIVPNIYTYIPNGPWLQDFKPLKMDLNW